MSSNKILKMENVNLLGTVKCQFAKKFLDYCFQASSLREGVKSDVKVTHEDASGLTLPVPSLVNPIDSLHICMSMVMIGLKNEDVVQAPDAEVLAPGLGKQGGEETPREVVEEEESDAPKRIEARSLRTWRTRTRFMLSKNNQ